MTDHALLPDPALTVALALGAGMLAQSVARHLRVPGIVVLLATGVLLGPDVADVIRPDSLGQTLHTLVGFAVAVILFEGGMNLNLKRLRREARSIRQLVSIGALVTAVGGTVSARYLMGWDWKPSMLFGTLVIVTGPTVINPLLRRIRVTKKVATVLEAEGVLVDAIGAIVAVVALELAISPSSEAFVVAPLDLFGRLGFGFVAGTVGGLLIALLLRVERLVPEGLENVFTLSLALVLFQGSNALTPESGIVTVTAAGLVVGNVRTRALGDLREFKEQLTVMLIGLLFVLLAADVRLEEVRALGWPGALTVLSLMFVVRPLNILAGTYGADLTAREKLFLCWLAPRGIVAAAVSSLFAQTLTSAGIPGGQELRAMVFLVIAVTVLVQGLSGGVVAQVLGVRRGSNTGYAILGANDLGRALGRVLQSGEHEVVFLESNVDATTAAEKEGFRVVFGNGLGESLLMRAEIEARAGCIGVTSNDAMNLLFSRKGREEFKVPAAWVALRRGHESVTPAMVKEHGGRVLFGEPRNLDLWTLRLERKLAATELWRRTAKDEMSPADHREFQHGLANALLPIAVRRSRRVFPMDDEVSFKKDDALYVLVFEELRQQAVEWLERNGWERLVEPVEGAGQP